MTASTSAVGLRRAITRSTSTLGAHKSDTGSSRRTSSSADTRIRRCGRSLSSPVAEAEYHGHTNADHACYDDPERRLAVGFVVQFAKGLPLTKLALIARRAGRHLNLIRGPTSLDVVRVVLPAVGGAGDSETLRGGYCWLWFYRAMHRQGVRSSWASMPESVRRAVDEIAGSAVHTATNLTGGFSPGPAARCGLADGRTVFVKAAGLDLNPISPGMHRREGEVLRSFDESVPAPKLIGVYDDGDWVALVIEWIDGRMPTAPIDTLDGERLLGLVEHLAVVEAGDDLESCFDAHPGLWGHWQQLRDAPNEGLDAWSLRHLDVLVDLEADVAEAIRGDRLVHLDLRSDNVLFADAGPLHDVVVDWPGASAGAPWVDLVGLLPSLELDGGPSAHHAFDRHPIGATADPEAASIFLTADSRLLHAHGAAPVTAGAADPSRVPGCSRPDCSPLARATATMGPGPVARIFQGSPHQRRARHVDRLGGDDLHSLHTPSSLPAGSRKWNRRPPGNAKIGAVMVPPAASTRAIGVLEVLGFEDHERQGRRC